MTVPANDRRSPLYDCTGGETIFGFDFLVRTAGELAVLRLRGGGEARLVYGVDYSITGIGNAAGGSANLLVPALDGDQYMVLGDIPPTRTADIAYTSSLPSALLNHELDHLQRQIAELRAQLLLKLGRSQFDDTGGNSEIPVGIGYLYIDGNGNLTLVAGSGGGGSLALPVSIEHGGTGASTAATARDNLDLGVLATKDLVGFVDIASGVVQFPVESRTITAPPGSPSAGQMWIVPASATGAWDGHTGKIARWSGTAWVYLVPEGGWTAYDKAAKTFLGYMPDVGWSAFGAQGTAAAASTLDGRIVGRFDGNGQCGVGVRGWWTADNRIFIAGTGTQLANADPAAAANWFPLQIDWDRTLGIKSIVSSLTSHYLIDANDELWSWGGNAAGQLGHGDTANRPFPVKVTAFSGSSIKIAKVIPSRVNSGGFETTYFLEKNGTGRVWGCGAGTNYVFGNAATTQQNAPIQIGTLANVVEVAFDNLQGPAFFRRSNGEVYVTGGPAGYANGLGTGAPAQTPTLVPSIENEGIVRMAVGAGATNQVAAVLLKSNGVPLVCGNGASGIGLGNTTTLATFQPVPVPDNEVLVDAALLGGAGIVLAFRSSAKNLHLCGYGGMGIRGDGSTGNMLSLVKPAGSFQGAVDDVKLAGPDSNAVVAVLAAGKLWTCGRDTNGETGQGKIATAAASRTWGVVKGLDGAVSSWGWSGAFNGAGLSVITADGRAKGGGYNADGSTGTQPGNLHIVSTLQNVKGLPDLLDPAADWHDGTGAPGATLGKNGDRYLDTVSGDVYRRENGVWVSTGNVRGPVGAAGHGGLAFDWSTATSGDPGPGKVLANHATLSSATALHVSKTGRNGEPLGNVLALLDDSTSSIKGRVRVFVVTDRTRWIEGTISGALTDQTAYYVVPLSSVSAGSAPAADAEVSFLDIPKGDKGDVGSGAVYAEANALAAGDGSDGSAGLDTGNGQIYPPKAAGEWPAPFELGQKVDFPAGASAIWIGRDYDSTLKAIRNRAVSGSLQPVLTRMARGAFGSNAVSGGADGWLSSGLTVTEKFAAGRDGVVAATRVLSTSAGSGSVRYRNTISLVAGTYCMVIDVKSNTGANQDFLMSRDGGSTSATKTATTTLQQFVLEFTLGSTTTVDLRFCYPTGAGHTMDFVIDKAFLWEGNTASVPADLIQRGDMLLGLHAKDTGVTVTNGAFDMTGGKMGSAELAAFLTGTECTMFAVVKRTGAYTNTAGYRQPFLTAAVESGTGQYWSLGEYEAEGYLRGYFGGLNAGNNVNFQRNFVGDDYHVVSMRANALGVDVWIDDVCVNAVYGTPASTAARLFTANSGNAATGSKHHWAAAAIWGRALRDDERRVAIKALRREVQAGGLALERPKNYLAALGDSITLGPSNDSYVQKYLANATQEVFVRNEAVGGSCLCRNPTAQLNLSTRMPWVTSSIPELPGDRMGRRHIVTILIGANDLQPYYNDADHFLADLGGFCDLFKARGAVVGIGTILPKGTAASGYATHNTLRAAVNPRLRLWKGWRADFIIDFAANTNIGDDADANNATYYNADGIHLITAGHVEAELVYRAAVNPWLLAA